MTSRDQNQDPTYTLTWDDLMGMPLNDRVSFYLGVADAIASQPASVPDDLYRLLGAGVSHDEPLRALLRWPGATEGTPGEQAEIDELWTESPDVMKGLSAALHTSTVQPTLTKLRDGGDVTESQWTAYNAGQDRPEDKTGFQLGLELALAASMLAGGAGAATWGAAAFAGARAAGTGLAGASGAAAGGAARGLLSGAARPAKVTAKTLWRGLSEGATRVTAGVLRKTPTEVAAGRRALLSKAAGSRLVQSFGRGGLGRRFVYASTAVGAVSATEQVINAMRNPDDVLSDVAYDQSALADMDAAQVQADRAAHEPSGAVRFGSMPLTSVVNAVRTIIDQSDLAATAPAAIEQAGGVAGLDAQRAESGELTSGYADAPGVPTEPVEEEEPSEPLNEPIGGFAPPFFRETPGQVTTTVADRAEQQRQAGWRPYYTWHTESILGSMTPGRLAQTQALMIDAGLIDPEQAVGGVINQVGRLDPQTIGAMENVLNLSNANPGTPWQDMLDALAQEGRRRRTEEAEAVVPFIRPAYVAPDYATLAQEVKSIASTKLPRELQDWEVKLLADELGGFRVEEYEAAVESARNQFEAEQAATRLAEQGGEPAAPTTTVADRAEQQIAAGPSGPPTGPEGYPEVAVEGGGRAVDPRARIAELIEERYGDEIDRRGRIDEASKNFSTTMQSLGAIEQMVGGG